MYYYVYETTNIINEKKYIGKRSCHCEIEEDKYLGSGIALKLSIKKYGIENFKKEILMICNSDEEAYEIEKIEIDKVKANINPRYYNITVGGKGGMNGFKFSDESRLKMRNSQLGKKSSLETRMRISNSNEGRIVKKETREKISIANTGVKKSEQARLNMSNSAKGKTFSEETRMKIGLASKGRIVSEETRRKMSEAHKGKISPLTGRRMLKVSPLKGRQISDETKHKISIANKGKKRTPENIEKLRQARLGKKLSEETKAKMRKTMKEIEINKGAKNGMYGVFGEKNPTSKKVICLNTLEIFGSMHEASRKYGIDATSICACCRGRRKSCGKINGEKMVWSYYEDYLKEA